MGATRRPLHTSPTPLPASPGPAADASPAADATTPSDAAGGAPRRVQPLRVRRTPLVRPAAFVTSPPAGPTRTADADDWKRWIRQVVRLRSTVWLSASSSVSADGCIADTDLPRPPRDYLAEVTRVSFAMDGIDVAERDVQQAVLAWPVGRSLGPRQGARLRAHVAVLRRVEHQARRRLPLTPTEVSRWHAAMLAGLPAAGLDGAASERLAQVCARVSSPHRRLRPAIEEIARLHIGLLADPLVPSFNGILARLLLAAHLARCGLPPVCPASTPASDVPRFTRLLRDGIVAALHRIVATWHG